MTTGSPLTLTDPRDATAPSFLGFARNTLNDPRDVSVVWLMLQCLLVVVAGVALFFVKNVPVLMLSCAGSNFEATGKPNRWTQHDTGAASTSMALQAESMGLMAHQMGGYDAEKARAAFGIPADYTPMAMIAIGYQAEPDVLDEETKKKELAPRGRKAIGERFFEGGWGKAISA